MGMTIAEKILAAHADRSEVKPGEFLWCRVGGAAGVPGEMLEKLGVEKLWDPQRVFVTEDHLAPPPPWRRPTTWSSCAGGCNATASPTSSITAATAYSTRSFPRTDP